MLLARQNNYHENKQIVFKKAQGDQERQNPGPWHWTEPFQCKGEPSHPNAQKADECFYNVE
jgi:hypothetical protein